MSDFDRRQFLKGILVKLAQAAGTVVVASAAVSTARAQGHKSEGAETEDFQKRLAATGKFPAEETAADANEFLNGAFRNSPAGAFRNSPVGAFLNHPVGAFRNGPVGGFRNYPSGGFGNGGWPNGGWGGFRNGGWPNHAWRNWW
jgi:hypothetical protein